MAQPFGYSEIKVPIARVMSSELPNKCILRPALANDMWNIRKLVFSAKLEPTQLRWSNFWVIECEEKIIACGQLRSYLGAQELGSLVVDSKWRSQGIGSYLAKHLIAQATQPLYLECASYLSNFYTRLGFTPVAMEDLPKALKWKFGFTQLATKIVPILSLKIMRYAASS